MAGLSERIYLAFRSLRRSVKDDRVRLSAWRGSWPPIILSYWEAYGQNAAHARLPAPSAREISDMETVLGWMTWLGRSNRELMEIVFRCCGCGLEPTQVAGLTGLHRNTVRIKRDEGLRRIAERFLS